MMKTSLEPSEDNTTKQRRQSADPQTDLQTTGVRKEQSHALAQRIAAGPVMAAQRKAIDRITVSAVPVQKLSPEEDEEPLQGKFTAQRQGPEEEDLLQGLFEPDAPGTATRDTRR
jgi:hypothetical protein